MNKICIIVSTLLISSCSSATSESIPETSLEKEIAFFNTFQDTKRLLLDYLTEDNVEEVNELAINYGIFKPMYSQYYFSEGEKQYSTSFGYLLNQNRGNDAYQEALNNLYFRKAIFSLFTHDEYEMTCTYVQRIQLNSEKYSPTYQTTPNSKAIVLEEGVAKAKEYYNKAKETGLKDDHVEIYLWDQSSGEVYRQKNSLIESLFSEVFGSFISFKYKYYDLDFSSSMSNILVSYVPFYNEINLGYYDMYTTLQSLLSDFVYSSNNKASKTPNEDMESLYNTSLVDATYN